MSNSDRGQVSGSAAEIYESFFVRCLFQQWTGQMCDAGRLHAGNRVLDVACGSGVLARAAAARVAPGGHVTGADINDGMLAVARRSAAAIEWRQCAAEQLPFDDASFDAVLCQFGLMFFADRAQAVREMTRVLRPGGRLAVAVWDGLDATPGYAAMTDLLQRLFGDAAAAAMRAPFSLGDETLLAPYFRTANLGAVEITTHEGQAVFDSIDAWVNTEIKGWTLADMIDDAQMARLLERSRAELGQFVLPAGQVAFPTPAHIVAAVKV